jgi:hypothetical protein
MQKKVKRIRENYFQTDMIWPYHLQLDIGAYAFDNIDETVHCALAATRDDLTISESANSFVKDKRIEYYDSHKIKNSNYEGIISAQRAKFKNQIKSTNAGR